MNHDHTAAFIRSLNAGDASSALVFYRSLAKHGQEAKARRHLTAALAVALEVLP